jgi:hypothetical protein
MICTLTMTLISESQEGEIGEDWKYDLDVKVFNGKLDGEAMVSVPKHNLPSGVVREPYGAPEPVVLFRGECEEPLLLRMNLTATEVDMFVNDVGKASRDLQIDHPAPGTDKVTKEVDIAAGVRESPGIIPKSAVFTVRVRFTLTCD